MKNLLHSAFLILITHMSLASADVQSVKTDEQDQPQLGKYGVAVMIYAESADSIAESGRIYQLVVGKLQREFRKADFAVFNAVMPANNQPDWTNASAIRQAVSELKNPYIDTVLLVNAQVKLTGASHSSEPEVTVQLKFYDIASGQVFADLSHSTRIERSTQCDSHCPLKNVDLEIVGLGSVLSASAISALHNDSPLHHTNPGQYLADAR
jgi:hypothetical protein